MLERYGILTRGDGPGRGHRGGFSTLYPNSLNLEVLGTARRGYFVEGLGGARFALSGAVEGCGPCRPRDRTPSPCWPPPTRPALGSTLPWPKLESGRKAARTAGLRGGEPDRLRGSAIT